MGDHESNNRTTPSVRQRMANIPDPAATPKSSTGSLSPANEELLSGTGSIPMIASSAGAAARAAEQAQQEATLPATSPAPKRYVRQRPPHRSQGTVEDLVEDGTAEATYTHDSNISVGGSTPLSGMAYRRSRNSMTKVRNGMRYGQYLEIPKGRRTLFASRERARRRRSVLALLAVTALLVLAAMGIWTLMQKVLG